DQIADRGGGQVLAQRLPVVAVIEGNVDGGFRAGEEQAFLLGVFADDVDPAPAGFIAGEAVDDLGPGLAAVVGAPDERHVGVGAAAIGGEGAAAAAAEAGGNVGGLGVEVAGLDGVVGQAGGCIGDVADVRPFQAVIAGGVDLAVAAHRPEDAFLGGGDGEVIDGSASACAAAASSGAAAGRGRRLGLAARHHGLAFFGGEVGAEGFPGLRTVAGDHDALVANVHGVGIEGSIKALPGVAAGAVFAGVGAEVGGDVLPLAGLHVDLDEAAAAAAGAVADAVEDVGVERIGFDGAELGRRKRAPVGGVDLAEVAEGALHDGAGVLLGGHHPIRVGIVGGDMVDLPEGLVVPGAPGLAVVEGDAGPLIGADQHAVAIGRVNPHVVVVFAAGRALERSERLAAVGRAVQRRGNGVHDVGVLRIHPDAATVGALAVGDAGVIAGHVLPGGAAVVGAEQAGAALGGAADHEDALAVGVHRHGDADAAGQLGERGDRGPGHALVGGFVEPGRHRRRAAAAAATGSASALGGSEDEAGHLVVEFEIAGAVDALGLEHALPVLAAVGGAVDAAARVAGVAGGRGEDDVGILGIDDDLIDLGGVGESDMGPGLAGVGGLVHAVAVGAADRVAAAGIDHVGIGRSD